MEQLSRGFTLVETVIAAAILVIASTAIASLFVSSIQTNMNEQDRAAAIVLLSDKLEQLRVSPVSGPDWTPGTHVEYPAISSNGLPFARSWEISSAVPPQANVIVARESTEMIRATTTVAAKW